MMKNKMLWLAPLILLCFASCDKNKDLNRITGLQPISDDWVFRDLSLPESYDYMELRLSDGLEDEPVRVQDSSGVKCDEQIADCQTRFDTLSAPSQGFHYDCLPGHCYHYIVSRKGDQLEVWGKKEDLSSWLGAIDDISDALLWVYADGYYFKYNDSKVSGIKQGDGVFYVMALKLVRDCDPVRTDRFLLEVNRQGGIKILDQDLHHESNGCI